MDTIVCSRRRAGAGAHLRWGQRLPAHPVRGTVGRPAPPPATGTGHAVVGGARRRGAAHGLGSSPSDWPAPLPSALCRRDVSPCLHDPFGRRRETFNRLPRPGERGDRKGSCHGADGQPGEPDDVSDGSVRGVGAAIPTVLAERGCAAEGGRGTADRCADRSGGRAAQAVKEASAGGGPGGCGGTARRAGAPGGGPCPFRRCHRATVPSHRSWSEKRADVCGRRRPRMSRPRQGHATARAPRDGRCSSTATTSTPRRRSPCPSPGRRVPRFPRGTPPWAWRWGRCCSTDGTRTERRHRLRRMRDEPARPTAQWSSGWRRSCSDASPSGP